MDFANLFFKVINDYKQQKNIKTDKEFAQELSTEEEMVQQSKISRWFKTVKNGDFLTREQLAFLIKAMKLDSFISNLLYAYSGYQSIFIPQSADELHKTQRSVVKYSIRNITSWFGVFTTLIPGMLQTEAYIVKLLKQWDGTEYEQSNENIKMFIKKRKIFQKEALENDNTIRIIIWDNLFQNILLEAPEMIDLIKKTITICKDCENITLRLLDIKKKYIPPPNFIIIPQERVDITQDMSFIVKPRSSDKHFYELYEKLFWRYWEDSYSYTESLLKLEEIKNSLEKKC